MTTRTVAWGGTDWSDGQVLYAADLNDTFNANIPSTITMPGCAYNTVVQGTWLSATSGSGTLINMFAINTYNSSGAINDEIDFNLCLKAGTYKLIVGYVKAPTAGIVTVYLDGSTIATIDEYAVGITYGLISTTTGITVTAGLHTLKWKVTSKNGSSGSYEGYLDGFMLVRTGA